MNEIKLSQSLNRPAWTADDLNAYRHKHTVYKGKPVILKDYYIKSEGKQ